MAIRPVFDVIFAGGLSKRASLSFSKDGLLVTDVMLS